LESSACDLNIQSVYANSHPPNDYGVKAEEPLLSSRQSGLSGGPCDILELCASSGV
jgi:hypothetical protein